MASIPPRMSWWSLSYVLWLYLGTLSCYWYLGELMITSSCIWPSLANYIIILWCERSFSTTRGSTFDFMHMVWHLLDIDLMRWQLTTHFYAVRGIISLIYLEISNILYSHVPNDAYRKKSTSSFPHVGVNIWHVSQVLLHEEVVDGYYHKDLCIGDPLEYILYYLTWSCAFHGLVELHLSRIFSLLGLIFHI